MRRGLAIAALLALVLPAGASAHASLTDSSPGFRDRVEDSPAQVVLGFSQVILPDRDSIAVINASGRRIATGARLAPDRRSVSVPLPAGLATGAYTVRWRVLSASDGHIVGGVFTFGVRADAPPPTEAFGAGGPTDAEKLVRWLAYIGLSLLAGGIVLRLLALPAALPRSVDGRFHALVGGGALLAINAGIAAFLLRADSALELPAGQFLYADLSPFAAGTRFGIAWVWMTLATVVAGLLVALSWLVRHRAPLWPALALALGLGSGFSLSGHSASAPGASALEPFADWVHIAAASVWIGGLATLALVVWPLEPSLRRRAFLRFSSLATALVGIVLVAGVYLGVERLLAPSDLWTTGYGRVLMLKIGLVALALGWGAAHHLLVRPRLAGSESVPGGRVGRSLLGESVAGVAVLLAAAVLVNTEPPSPDGTVRAARAPLLAGAGPANATEAASHAEQQPIP